jgi:hypothetical protein
MSKKSDPKRKTAKADVADADVIGDLVDSSFDIEVEEGGTVRLHARCSPGDDPAACAEKVRFLVEALGAEMVAPPDLPR